MHRKHSPPPLLALGALEVRLLARLYLCLPDRAILPLRDHQSLGARSSVQRCCRDVQASVEAGAADPDQVVRIGNSCSGGNASNVAMNQQPYV